MCVHTSNVIKLNTDFYEKEDGSANTFFYRLLVYAINLRDVT